MGMFFWVKKEDGDKCPYCGYGLVENYQSKESIEEKHDWWGGCCEKHPEPLPMLEKSEVENFYTHCEKCGEWIEYKNENQKFELQDNKDIWK